MAGCGGWDQLAGDEASLRRVVGRAFAREPAPTGTWIVDPAPVPFTNMTTAALARVRGTFADDPDGHGWSVFVKTVQPPSCSPLWRFIPPEHQAQAFEDLPWLAEAELYGSPIGRHLPDGLRLPTLYAVEAVDDERTAIWMEDVPAAPGPWDLTRYRQAARALGRLAGRLPDGRVPAALPVRRRDLRSYFSGRVSRGVLPALARPETWDHPLVRGAVDGRLQTDLATLASSAPAILDRLDALPRSVAHGDACPQNLLLVGADFVVIDWAFVGVYAVGYDLAQLLAGRAESGELDADALAAVDAAILPAYLEGLGDEGASVAPQAVEAGYVGALAIRSGFSALPLEHLAEDETAALRLLFSRRAAYARFIVERARRLARAI